MSPDNHAMDKRIQRLASATKGIASVSTTAAHLLAADWSDFISLSVFLGNSGDYLAMVKRFSDDGSPEVLFAAGQSPLEALMNVDAADNQGKWKPDKRYKG